MKILKHKSIIVAALLAAAIGLMSCGNNGGTLASITVSPADTTIAMGTNQQFTAMATFTNGTMLDWTTAAEWSTSNAGAVTISNSFGSYGLATSLVSASTGTISVITITATDTANNISGTATLTIVDRITAIKVTPTDQIISFASTTQQQFTATGTFKDATTQIVTQSVHWHSSNTGIATISNTAGTNGLALATGATGTTTIRATDPITGISNSTTLEVTP